MDFESCAITNSNKFISVEENKRSFRIVNPYNKMISKVTVDGCLIKDGRERCDYLFEIDKPIAHVIYVELKGADIQKASEQLGATIGYCINRHSGIPISCHIVASRVPKSGPKSQELKVLFAKRYKALLVISTTKSEVSIEGEPLVVRRV